MSNGSLMADGCDDEDDSVADNLNSSSGLQLTYSGSVLQLNDEVREQEAELFEIVLSLDIDDDDDNGVEFVVIVVDVVVVVKVLTLLLFGMIIDSAVRGTVIGLSFGIT